MASHQFSIGEFVTLNWQPGGPAKKAITYTVMSQMPPVGVELQYRIKSIGEPYQRVVTEHQLTRLAAAAEVDLVA